MAATLPASQPQHAAGMDTYWSWPGQIQPKLDKLTTINNQHMVIYNAESLMDINKT